MHECDNEVLDESSSEEAEDARDLASPRLLGKRLWGFVLVLLSAVMFSLMSLLVKLLINDGVSPLQAVLYRSMIQLTLTYITMLYCKVPVCGAMDKEDRRWLVARGVVGASTMTGFYLSVQILSLADASVCMFTAPVWTVFLARAVLKEPIRIIHIAAALCSVIGVIFIAKPASVFADAMGSCVNTTETTKCIGSLGVGKVTMARRSIGVALGLSSALLQAFAFITMRRIRHLHYLLSVWSISWGGVVIGSGFALASNHLVYPPSTRSWIMVFALGGVGYWGQVFLNLGLQIENAGPASIVRNLDIVLAFVWQFLFLDNPVQWTSLVGGAIITFAALAVAVDKLKRTSDVTREIETVSKQSYTKVSVEENSDV